MTKRNRRVREEDDDVLVNISEVTSGATSFFEKNQNLILGGIAALILIVGGLMAYKHLYQAPREDEAALALFKAQSQFERDSFALALSNPGPNAEGFLDIADNYSGTKAGNTANYYAGVSYLHLGQYDDAISYLKNFSPAGDITPIMKHGLLGDAYSEKGDFDAALGAYKDAASYENNFLTPYYMFKYAMLLNNQGNKEESLKVLRDIKSEYPSSSTAGDVDKYISMME